MTSEVAKVWRRDIPAPKWAQTQASPFNSFKILHYCAEGFFLHAAAAQAESSLI